MSNVYLCGGINALSDSDAKEWRTQATHFLVSHGLCVLDPMRRDYRGIEYQNVTAIVRGDLSDIVECDAVLVNATRPSWGTAMEIVYARTMGRPIYAFVEPGKPISPWLIYHCSEIKQSLSTILDTLIRHT